MLPIPRIETRNFRVKDFLQGPLFDKITTISVSPKSRLVQIAKDYFLRAYSIHPGYLPIGSNLRCSDLM